MTEHRETFPSAVEAVFLVVGLFAAEYLVGAMLLDLRAFSGIHPRDIAGVIAVLGNGILFSALLYYKGMSYRSLFHPSHNSVAATVGTLTIPVLLVVPGLLMAMSAVEAILASAFPLSHGDQAMFERMMSNSLESVVTGCILAPVLEEMLFRGIILRSFLNQYRRSHAIVASAVLFGLAHLNIYQFAVGMALGIVSGWLYERARSLWPCILLHAAYNSAITWIYFSLASGDANYVWEPPMDFWIASALLAFAGATLLQRLLSSPKQAM